MKRGVELLLVAALVALAIWMRGDLNNSGMPTHVFPRTDEVHYVHRVTDFLNGRWSLDYFINPSGYMYPVYAATCLFGGQQVLAGHFDSWAEFRLAATLNPYYVTMCARVVSMLAGAGAVAVLYLVGKRMFSARIGLLSAAALAVNQTHVMRGPLAGNEETMVSLVLVFFWLAWSYVQNPTTLRHVACGLALGVATSTKYNAGIHVVTLAAASLIVFLRESPSWRAVVGPRYFAGFLAAPLGFALASPFALLEHRAFWRDFQRQASYLGGYPGDERSATRGLDYYVRLFPELNNGLPFAIVCGAALVWCLVRALRHRDERAVMLVAAVVPLYLYLGAGTFSRMRFALPAIPFVLLAGAWLLDRALGALLARIPRAGGGVRGAVPALAGAVLLAPHAAATKAAIRADWGGVDERKVLFEWLHERHEVGMVYADLVHPAVYRFYDEMRPVIRYGLSPHGRSPADAARLERFVAQSIDVLPLTDLLPSSESLEAAVRAVREEGCRRLILGLRTDPPFRRGKRASPDFRGMVYRLPQIYGIPAVRECKYWEQLAGFVATMPLVGYVATQDRRFAMALFEIE